MNVNRRQFCIAVAGSAVAAQSASSRLIDRGFATVEKLADGVYVTMPTLARVRSTFRTAASWWDANELYWWRVTFNPRAPLSARINSTLSRFDPFCR
jgi:hypothetical protein